MKQPLKIVLLTLSLLTAAACTQTGDSEKQITKQYNKIENLIIDHIFETAGPTASQIDEAEKQMANQLDRAEKEVNKIIIAKPENKMITSFDDYFIARGKPVRAKPSFYRKFLGQTPERWYVVQDFYQDSHNKRTDPYIIRNKNQLTKIMPEHEEGILISWSENGEKILEARNKNGAKDGLTILYRGGKKMTAINYKNGAADGLLMSWHENGQKSGISYHKNDKLDGPSTHWYENGKKEMAQNFKEGKSDGVSFYWYENGLKKQSISSKNNNLEGTSIVWYENGQKKSEMSFRNGKQDGSQYFWNTNGTLNETRNYKDGEVVKETN